MVAVTDQRFFSYQLETKNFFLTNFLLLSFTDRNEPSRFFGDGAVFKAKLIGILEVGEARGDRMCQEALQVRSCLLSYRVVQSVNLTLS